MAQVEAVSQPLGISWLALGVNPFTPVERIGWIPKSRYQIMAAYLPPRGALAHYMMKMSCTIQASPPSLAHSSRPWTPSSAAKYARPPRAVRLAPAKQL